MHTHRVACTHGVTHGVTHSGTHSGTHRVEHRVDVEIHPDDTGVSVTCKHSVDVAAGVDTDADLRVSASLNMFHAVTLALRSDRRAMVRAVAFVASEALTMLKVDGSLIDNGVSPPRKTPLGRVEREDPCT